MKRTLLFSVAAPVAVLSFVLVACGGSSSSEGDGTTGLADDNLSLSTAACQGKSCGEACTICPPGATNCYETAVLKACNAKGRCSAGAPHCALDAGPAPTEDAGALDGGPAPKPDAGPFDGGPAPDAGYSPCGGKTCGATCTICPPGAPDCFETAVIKFCHPGGACLPYAPACIPPPPYQPCAGKACGASCTICDPADPTCAETAVLKQCNKDGACTPMVAACN